MIDEVCFAGEEEAREENDPTPVITSRNRFTFNTIEVDEIRGNSPLLRSSLTNMTSTTAVRTSVAFTPMVEQPRPRESEKEDICFQSRSNRAAALERQFQTILHS